MHDYKRVSCCDQLNNKLLISWFWLPCHWHRACKWFLTCMPCLHRDDLTCWSVSSRLLDAWHVRTSHVFLHSSLSWALPDAFFVCRCTAIRERWHVRWHVRGVLLLCVIVDDMIRACVVGRDACAIFPGCVICDYFRSLSGLRYQCRTYHLCWLRCDFYTRMLPQMTQVWSLQRIIISRHRHAIIIVIVTLHMIMLHAWLQARFVLWSAQ